MGDNEPIISKTTSDENNRVLKIDYYVSSGFTLTDGAQRNPTFGITVRLSIDGKCSDCSTIEDISPSREMVTRLVQQLADNLVTPVTLKDVVEDCLAAQF